MMGTQKPCEEGVSGSGSETRVTLEVTGTLSKTFLWKQGCQCSGSIHCGLPVHKKKEEFKAVSGGEGRGSVSPEER